MRVLALDYGSARCGCALSDPSGTIVTPIEASRARPPDAGSARSNELVRERDVERVVVGLPLSLQRRGHRPDPRDARVRAALSLRLGTGPGRAARRALHHAHGPADGVASASEDSRAAAHLLESWLTPGCVSAPRTYGSPQMRTEEERERDRSGARPPARGEPHPHGHRGASAPAPSPRPPASPVTAPSTSPPVSLPPPPSPRHRPPRHRPSLSSPAVLPRTFPPSQPPMPHGPRHGRCAARADARPAGARPS